MRAYPYDDSLSGWLDNKQLKPKCKSYSLVYTERKGLTNFTGYMIFEPPPNPFKVTGH